MLPSDAALASLSLGGASMVGCYYGHTPATCGLGCDRLGYCYAQAIDDLCHRIRAAGEVGPHAATAAYAVGMAAIGGGAEARRRIALLDLADRAERED